ncbi:MAG: hypothetical protein ACRDN6_15350, partial [Gaiellaceae bacterium]
PAEAAGSDEATLVDALAPQGREPEDGAAGARRVAPPESWFTETYETCEVAIRRGPLTSQFYARPLTAGPGTGTPLPSSPTFRLRGGPTVEQSDAARAALLALVEILSRDGWEPEGRNEHWFGRRFRRAETAATLTRPRGQAPETGAAGS